jgi:hypothetical protein
MTAMSNAIELVGDEEEIPDSANWTGSAKATGPGGDVIFPVRYQHGGENVYLGFYTLTYYEANLLVSALRSALKAIDRTMKKERRHDD